MDVKELKVGDRVVVANRNFNTPVEGVVTEVAIADESTDFEGIKNGTSGIFYDLKGESYWCYHGQILRKVT